MGGEHYNTRVVEVDNIRCVDREEHNTRCVGLIGPHNKVYGGGEDNDTRCLWTEITIIKGLRSREGHTTRFEVAMRTIIQYVRMEVSGGRDNNNARCARAEMTQIP